MLTKKKYLSWLILFAFMFGLVPILPAIGADITQLKIEIDKTTLEENERISAEAYLIYTDGSSKRVTSAVAEHPISWQSQDSTIAEVDKSGYITGKSAGTTFVDAIYTTSSGEIYSDQIKITVTAINYIPYSVQYSPSDGQLEPYQPIEMQFPCEVEITDDYYRLSGSNCGYKLYQQNEDKTKVYFKLVLHPNYQPLFPDITQLPWSTINSRINYYIDDFKKNIKPMAGEWEYLNGSGALGGYSFKAKTEQELALLGVYPKNNSTLYNKNLMGNTGKALNSILAPEEGANIPLVFLFNKPLRAGDITKFTINSTSPIGGITGNWNSYDTPWSSSLFYDYLIIPRPVYNYAVYGYSLSDITATMTLEPGAFKIAESDEYNTETYSTTYIINPSIGDTPANSLFTQGEIKINAPLEPKKGFEGGNLRTIWEFNGPEEDNKLLNSGIKVGDNLIFGGKNYIYAVNHNTGTLAWRKDSGVKDKTYWIKPEVSASGVIYYMDFEKTTDALHCYQPYIVALNQDGSLRHKVKLPTTSSNTVQSLYITENSDIVVLFTGTTLGGLGTLKYFLARYTEDGELKAMAGLGTTDILLYREPDIIYADDTKVILNEYVGWSLAAFNLIGASNDTAPLWSIPYTDKKYLKTIENNGKLLLYNYSDTTINEIDIADGSYITHTLPTLKNKHIYTAPLFKNGVFYTADGNQYDIQNQVITKNFEPVAIPTELNKAEKYALIGIDGNGDSIYLYTIKKDAYDKKVYFHLGGENWLDENAIWEGEICIDDLFEGDKPRVYDIFLGSIILDYGNNSLLIKSLIKLDVDTAIPPIIPPVTPEEPEVTPPDKPKDEGGGGTTPEGPKDEPEVTPEPEPEIEPEPEVTPEPEPEPEEITEEEPKVTPTPAPEPKEPRIVETKPEKPIITGTVKGVVKLKDGTPLANARLELHSKPRVTRTDKNGYYEFTGVPLGQHKLYLADLKFADEKILLNTVEVEKENSRTHLSELAKIRKGEIVEATNIELTEAENIKEVNIIADISLPKEEKPKFPWWIIPLLLIILLIIRRRIIKLKSNVEE